jgi:hypothetical protein
MIVSSIVAVCCRSCSQQTGQVMKAAGCWSDGEFVAARYDCNPRHLHVASRAGDEEERKTKAPQTQSVAGRSSEQPSPEVCSLQD